MPPRTLSVVYSSGLVAHGMLLATLATYYDEVWFPYPFNCDPDANLKFTPEGDQPALRETLEWQQRDYVDWRSRYALLFDERILRTLPPPFEIGGPLPANHLSRISALCDDPPRDDKVSSMSVFMGTAALAVHHLYAQKPSPEIFIRGQRAAKFDLDGWLADFV